MPDVGLIIHLYNTHLEIIQIRFGHHTKSQKAL